MKQICRLFHRRLMYAGGSQYECRTCGRRFDSPWRSGEQAQVQRMSRRWVIAFGMLMACLVVIEIVLAAKL